MHAIQVQDTPMFLQRTLVPGVKLLGERLVQAADGTGTGSDSQEGLGHFSYFMRACPSYKHLGQSFGDMGFIATVAVKDLRVELAFTVSRHFDLFDATCSGDQIAGVGAVAIPCALGAVLAPAHADERVKLFAHYPLQHHAQGGSSQFA
jgi:hypothetical protein